MNPKEAKSWAGHSRATLQERWGRQHVHLYRSVPSTNDVAREMAEEGAPAGTVVLAGSQSRGKGREGRIWHSPAEVGVYLSVVLRPSGVSNPNLLPILAGLGAADELERQVEGLAPALKWPNDLMTDGRKFGGVLCEGAWDGEEIRYLVAGTGINVRPLPDDLPDQVLRGATSVDEAVGHEVELALVAGAAMAGVEAHLTRPPPALDARLLDLLDRFDWLRDRRVSVEIPGEEEPLPGACVGIAPDGALLFRPDRGALRRLHDAHVLVETDG